MADNNFDPYETLNIAADSEIRTLRVGNQWYDMGAETEDGKLIAYLPGKNSWEQVGDKKSGDYDFYDGPTQEFYMHPYIYAMNNHEIAKWDSSENLNQQCKNALGSAVASFFDKEFNALNINALKDVVNRFGVERTAYVLAESIIDYKWDNRISMENRSWAVAVDSNFGDLDYIPSISNQFLFLPTSEINAAIDLFKIQTHYDPTLAIMNTDKDPYPFVYPGSYKTAEFKNELPEYLWSWRKNCKCADSITELVKHDRGGPVGDYMRLIIQKYGTERVSAVLGTTLNLYASNPVISDENKKWLDNVYLPEKNLPEISGYIIPVGASELNDFLDKCIPALQLEIDMEKESEDVILNGSPVSDDKFFFSIYQDPYRAGNAEKPDFSEYKSVYCAEEKGWKREGTALNDVYDKFLDGKRPAGFSGYPLSIGDIIVINHDGDANAFLIGPSEFKKLPDFVQMKREENALIQQNGSMEEPDSYGAR